VSEGDEGKKEGVLAAIGGTWRILAKFGRGGTRKGKRETVLDEVDGFEGGDA
jgi:hypothetical protein